MPNINLHLATSLVVFIGSIAAAYYTQVGWWALGGLFFYASAQIGKSDDIHEIFSYIILGLGILFYGVAFVRMGWTF